MNEKCIKVPLILTIVSLDSEEYSEITGATPLLFSRNVRSYYFEFLESNSLNISAFSIFYFVFD